MQHISFDAVLPEEAVVLNPGKGWEFLTGWQDKSDDLAAIVPIRYFRFHWSRITSAEGEYDWSVLDDALNESQQRGGRLSIRVCAMSTHCRNNVHEIDGKPAAFTAPRWLYDKGCRFDFFELTPRENFQGVPGWKALPDFGDPIFIEAAAQLARDLADRYDGHPALEYVDIGTYGNWGEWHNSQYGHKFSISQDAQIEHIDLYRDAFRRTPLVKACNGRSIHMLHKCDWYCIEHGVGLRRDGVFRHDMRGDTLTACFGKVPAAVEMAQRMDEFGLQEPEQLTAGFENMRPTWAHANGGRYNMQWLWDRGPEWQQTMRTLANRMGYHFVLRDAEVDPTLLRGGRGELVFRVSNLGLSPTFLWPVVKVALLDADGEPLAVQTLEDLHPRRWMPADRGEAVYTERQTLQLPDVPGAVGLAIRLQASDHEDAHVIRWANRGLAGNGWLPLLQHEGVKV